MVGLSRAVSGVNHSRTGVSLLKKKKILCKCVHGGEVTCSGHTQMWAGGGWCPGPFTALSSL